jgi:hypothetical protein
MGKRSKNLPEVIQRIRKSKANIPAITTRATTIVFANREKRFDTRLTLLLRWVPTVLITVTQAKGSAHSTTASRSRTVVMIEAFYNLNKIHG